LAAARLLVLRHGPTDWNFQGLLQGRNNTELSRYGCEVVRAWRLPSGAETLKWFVSPLQRAQQTAEILNIIPEVEQNLIEASWGKWEGAAWRALRQEGHLTQEMEAQGLDLRPPGGESPRDVQRRLRPWLNKLAEAGGNYGAVTHKGVIRALYALATGWDMRGDPPHKLRDPCCHTFELSGDGQVSVAALNTPLGPLDRYVYKTKP
jgi:probable phosphoglycerate mutase